MYTRIELQQAQRCSGAACDLNNIVCARPVRRHCLNNCNIMMISRAATLQRPSCQSRVLKCAPQRTHVVVVKAMYNFADVDAKGYGRRNKAFMRKEERQLAQVVDGLTAMTEKQLKGVQALTGDDVVDAVRIAAKLPGSNQGRKRQEGLIAKLLRDQLDEATYQKVVDAVDAARTSSATYVDPEVLAQVAQWRSGLVAGDAAVLEEILSVCARAKAAARMGQGATGSGGSEGDEQPGDMELGSSGIEGDEENGEEEEEVPPSRAPALAPLPDAQQIRTLARQLHQLTKEEAAEKAAATASADAASKERQAAGVDVDALAVAAAKKTKPSQAGSARTKKIRSVTRSLDSVLKVAAQAMISMQ